MSLLQLPAPTATAGLYTLGGFFGLIHILKVTRAFSGAVPFSAAQRRLGSRDACTKGAGPEQTNSRAVVRAAVAARSWKNVWATSWRTRHRLERAAAERAGIDLSARGETLGVAEFERMAQELRCSAARRWRLRLGAVRSRVRAARATRRSRVRRLLRRPGARAERAAQRAGSRPTTARLSPHVSRSAPAKDVAVSWELSLPATGKGDKADRARH